MGTSWALLVLLHLKELRTAAQTWPWSTASWPAVVQPPFLIRVLPCISAFGRTSVWSGWEGKIPQASRRGCTPGHQRLVLRAAAEGDLKFVPSTTQRRDMILTSPTYPSNISSLFSLLKERNIIWMLIRFALGRARPQTTSLLVLIF